MAFTQNHDQIGNRRGGERLAALVDAPRLRLAAALLLLSPSVPLLFMGEEYGDTAPFPYFVDHSDEALLEAVREGRAAEFGTGGDLSDPGSPSTFVAARPDRALRKQPGHADLYSLYRGLLAARARLSLVTDAQAATQVHAEGDLIVLARSSSDARLVSFFNLAAAPASAILPGAGSHAGPWRRVVDCGAGELGGTGPVFPETVEPGLAVTVPAFGFVSFLLQSERSNLGASLAG